MNVKNALGLMKSTYSVIPSKWESTRSGKYFIGKYVFLIQRSIL